MLPFPLIDPDLFFRNLPDPPKRDATKTNDPRYFDKFGYMLGEQGARISVVMWSKRVVSDSNPYDVDLDVNVTYLPTIKIAKQGLTTEAEKMKSLLGQRLQNIPLPTKLNAEDVHFFRINKDNSPYVLDARYGNYLFHFVFRIAKGGYFETEKAMFERLQALDTHIHETLLRAVPH